MKNCLTAYCPRSSKEKAIISMNVHQQTDTVMTWLESICQLPGRHGVSHTLARLVVQLHSDHEIISLTIVMPNVS